MKRLSVIIVVLILLLGGVSCDENGLGTPPTPDTTPPSIANVLAQEITETTVTITWTTDELATSQVEYGKTTDYGLTTTFDEELVTNHSVSLGDLTRNTSYHYRVKSTDGSSNEAVSGDHTFTTTSGIADQLLIHFIDVGQGDSILVDLGEIEILIDGGGKSPGVISYLNDYVEGALEVMVATHPHADHIGGLISVLGAFEVQEIWHNGDTSGSQTYAEFMAAVQAEGAEVHIGSRGDEIDVNELTFIILNPTTLAGTTNNNSIVLSLSYGEIDFLFTGDAEQEAEASMLAAGILSDIDILKVGHHGSSSSSSLSFLNTIKPEVAIYMAGAGNSYGHPHEVTIIALTNIGAAIYGTDVHGDVIVITNGITYNIQVEKQAPPITPSSSSGTTTNPNPPTPPSGGPVNVQITNIFYDGIVPQVESDEYVEITNLGTEPVNLQGWKLIDIDEGYPSFIFPSYILNPGQSIRVYTNEFHPEYGGFSFGRGSAVWNNSDPDTAVLYNALGEEVSRKSY